MRLNHIEISGFKSFPDRSELVFDGGVTAIVGPNGCGKSNLIDAISWVLGEQSARSLRGERMEDIIFSGSEGRRPTSTAEVRLQLSQVTVALTRLPRVAAPVTVLESGFDRGRHGNEATTIGGTSLAGVLELPEVGICSDDDEEESQTIARDVEIARRLFRSGESEYLIDGHVCRLRDVQDLLMDSGVGLKAYAVIEQGKIGQILGARPMERRQLLEEAAGVTKYKSRRRMAELKLVAAQQNLTRIDDIVFEVEKQRGTLKRQAAKARRYRRLREELRTWEKIQFTRKSELLTLAIEDAAERLHATRQCEQGVAAQLAVMESNHERLQIQLVETELVSSQARDVAHAHELELGRRQQQIEFDTSQVTVLAKALVSGQIEVRELEERVVPLKNESFEQRAAAEDCDAKRAIAEQGLEEAVVFYVDAQRAIEGLEGDVEASRSEVFAAVNSATTLRHVVEDSSASRTRIVDEIAKLDAELSDLAMEGEKATVDRNRTGDSVERVRIVLESIALSRVGLEAELVSVRFLVASTVDEVRVGEQSLASLVARLRSIEELIAAREGYSDAARLVLSTPAEIAHLGSVADYLDVDPGFERAVEASLEELVQYVIVPSAEEARKGMALARTGNAGRCGFIVVDQSPPVSHARPPHPALTPLDQVVRIDGVASETIRGLLGRRWMAFSFEDAAEAAQTTTDLIATPDGTVFCGPTVIRGGGKTEARGILATKSEVRDLASRMDPEEAILTQLRTKLTQYSNRAVGAEAELKTLQTEQHLAEKELLEFELGLTRLDEELERLQQKQRVVGTEHRKAEEERTAIDARQVEASQAIVLLEIEQRTADERLMSSQRFLVEAREAVELRGSQVTEAKAEHAALAERAAALSADVKRVDDVVRDLSERVMAHINANGNTVERRDALVVAIAASEDQLKRDVVRFESLRHEVRTSDDLTADVRQRIEEQVGQLRAVRVDLEAVRGDVVQLAVGQATAEADLVSLASLCEETLQLVLCDVCHEVEALERDGLVIPDSALVSDIEPDDLSSDLDDDGDCDNQDLAVGIVSLEPRSTDTGPSRPVIPEQLIVTLRDKIERLGPVNMMAIDQFDELEERFDFLTTQRKDLIDSVQATDEAIKRIDATTRERFNEAFTAVNGYFQEIFSTLFGGGRAGLVLIDETDVLESGIDIIAQPPGKRLQNIQLLSGGEKALTAMALMFAIFKFKPSPFCLLDEIDAPLDDANVARFVSMLRSMQDRTQFVLVTHNRKTMEISDRLYGVTMEEPGVSKLVSVKLN
jgi:chromosome segregation protein